MSWLVSSIANSLNLHDEADDDDDDAVTSESTDDGKQQPRGVKDDLSEFSETFTRQLRGVASFLAPPPSDPNPQSPDQHHDSNSAGISGIRSDLSEIGGRFRSGISKLSSNKAVSEFGKIASSFLQFVAEEGGAMEDFTRRGVVGVTQEVVAFATDVALHPNTWLDFPLPYNHEEEEEFDVSDIQQEHALAIEHLAPSLAALRMELCPGYMSEGWFWKIYFVLVHPRLTRQDAELLSTSQIVKARSMLTHELRTNKSIPEGYARHIDTLPAEDASSTKEGHPIVVSNDNPESVPVNISVITEDTSTVTSNIVVDKHPLESIEIPIIEEVSAAQSKNGKSSSDVSKGIDNDKPWDEDADEWLKEELPEMGNSSGVSVPIEDDEVSFSDLEEDDGEIPITYKKVVSASKSDATGGPIPETKDSSGWLDIEDINIA